MVLIGFLKMSASSADEIVLAADAWPPMNNESNSKNPGFLVEIAQKIFSKKGHHVKYLVYPWARAIFEARRGNINGVIGGNSTHAPGFIFPKNEQGVYSVSLFTKKNSNWKYSGIDSLKGLKLAVVLGYDYGKEVNKYISSKKNSEKVRISTGNDAIEKKQVNNAYFCTCATSVNYRFFTSLRKCAQRTTAPRKFPQQKV